MSMRTGVIGVGNMGSRMAGRIRDAGHDVVAFDRDRARLQASGVAAAKSVADLMGNVDLVLLSLPDSSVVEPVVLEPGGVAESGRRGQVVIDLSTSSPESTRRVSATCAARGLSFVDAGISGGASAAEAGTLTLMVGGDPEALARARPILDCFAAEIFHMGDSGAGHVAKVLNNFLNGISLAATAEVMVAAKRSGLDLEQFLAVLNSSSGVNFATQRRFPSIIKGDYLEGGLTGRLMAKDVRLYLDHLGRIGVPSLSGPACLAAFALSNSLGYEDVISNRVVDAIGDLAGGVRLFDGDNA